MLSHSDLSEIHNEKMDLSELLQYEPDQSPLRRISHPNEKLQQLGSD